METSSIHWLINIKNRKTNLLGESRPAWIERSRSDKNQRVEHNKHIHIVIIVVEAAGARSGLHVKRKAWLLDDGVRYSVRRAEQNDMQVP